MNKDKQDVGEFDYVIVGAGSAGCVLANRLSADPEKRVLLLEAGGRDNYIWIHIPVGYLYTMNNPRTDWCFKTEAEPGLNGRALNYPRGKTLGGCSSINGMIYMRGQARDYDQWRQFGNMGWSWDDVLPYFRRSEDYVHGEDEAHGVGGEWRVEEQRLSWEILTAFQEAAVQAGIPRTDDFTRGNNEGVGYFQVNQRRGVRWSTSKAFLKPVRERANLKVLTRAQATRIVLDGRKVTGLEFEHGGQPALARVRGELLLAAGSIGSPQLMELSGIGQGELLQRHGIEVAAGANGLQGAEHENAKRKGEQPYRQGVNGPAIRAVSIRPNEHGAQPARMFHQVRSIAGNPGPGISRAATEHRSSRATATPLSRRYHVGLQPAPDEPWRQSYQGCEPPECARDRAGLSERTGRQANCGGGHSVDAAHLRAASPRKVSARRVQTGCGHPDRRANGESRR